MSLQKLGGGGGDSPDIFSRTSPLKNGGFFDYADT